MTRLCQQLASIGITIRITDQFIKFHRKAGVKGSTMINYLAVFVV